jgi:hypothetical protein
MRTRERKVVTCRDAADEILTSSPALTTEDLRLCVIKLYDQSGHDTPSEKMRLNKLLCEARLRRRLST